MGICLLRGFRHLQFSRMMRAIIGRSQPPEPPSLRNTGKFCEGNYITARNPVECIWESQRIKIKVAFPAFLKSSNVKVCDFDRPTNVANDMNNPY